ncbi:putative mitochondrial carboxypeptidase, putative,metallo-peptidase, Clan MA(E), family 32 [Leptomonas pyrrhocoris]|uniref:carboxypeptidase Taq n=1 Tax=Leptomonas pyrrhocoris TaxID=157538 RepID=A0A0N1J4W2_LEPPY|nr:putative mitochondrial carboxypeptidase, putative,metallo-peptidase, Clan MA(E), family 32 [Leptomonas pyrrhocoris]XP_015659483.1 putative mitochondrial carboxypeptidase, putative,metallo-peptidase, Clan MA(E), family 32 [Leptomonas pyrrhocoris]KPA81043.1 putative mitochondrial carboxypeptidase, putative,metallo-peptidase, Clan MA(E), family 32 [Leptomonas pyrrhocoris]KPA81044.1 putative mitochondrial carboxypeptidase, putative,metallo-peptidase, Clan MA(E), family 32 [Leptomonas pyrrhocoris]|eukprot:XP_015659482.1 putative mitochondrial carboxypeptidase, putative,metallo-peptidase, Clan MA(E), family 32 [Leptomonas pyrrhocoris]
MCEAYNELEETFQRLYRFHHLAQLATWDVQTMMPPKGSNARGAAIAELKAVTHDLLTSEHTKKLLAVAAAEAKLTAAERANLREMKYRHLSERALPKDCVTRKAKLSAESSVTWAKARAENNFSLFAPYLKQAVANAREEARYRGAVFGTGLYESLFNMYESGMTLDSVDAIFQDIKVWLPPTLKRILASQKERAASMIPLHGPFPVEKQVPLCRYMAETWGFDFEGGRLDPSAHPFTGMTPEDTRITTNYSTATYTKAMFMTIHETGHSRYNVNRGPTDKRGQPVADARSLVIHESQSRLGEVAVARSAAFAEYATPALRRFLGDDPAFASVENVRQVHQHVEPGYIRLTADGVCYPLHILLRYEIERDLIEGRMEAEDVPRVWNEKMQQYLGLSTEGKDNVGCLQDMHWSTGTLGYFPTYTLGSMLAVQLMAAIKREIGENTVNDAIRTGQLKPILEKQKEKIWDHGCRYLTDELIRKATGEPLNPQYFKDYIERRYLRGED